MKLIFIAGPFKAENAWEIEQNIRRAEEIALQLWKLGFAVICPHANSRFFFGACPEDIFLEGYKEILKKCDGLILSSPGGQSKGTVEEIKIAEENGIPVFGKVHHLEFHFDGKE